MRFNLNIQWVELIKSGHGGCTQVGLKEVDDFSTSMAQYENNMWGGGENIRNVMDKIYTTV